MLLLLLGPALALRAGGSKRVPSLWSVGELLEVFINHSSNLFSHSPADRHWLLLQWQ